MLGWFLLPEMPLKTINLLFSSESALLPVWGEHVVSTGGKGRRDPTPTCSWVSPGPFFHHFMALFWWLLPVWWPAVSHQGGFSHEDRDPALCPRLLFPIFCLPVLKPVGFFFFSFPSQFPRTCSLLEISPRHTIPETSGMELGRGEGCREP